MTKKPQNQPVNWDKTSHRMALSLAIVICSAIALPAANWAEGSSDLNIAKDGNNVNVNLNTASSSDVSIRRSDDIMVIKVPKSYKGGINIDPALKKNSVVQEVETSSGRAITIQSQQIYLHTWDGAPGSAPASSSQAEKSDKSDKPEKTESKNNDTSSQDELSPGKPGFLQLSPRETATSNENATGHQSNNTKSHRKHTSEANPPRPLDITRLLEQGSLLSEPIAPGPMNEPAASHVHHGKHSSVASEPEPIPNKGKPKFRKHHPDEEITEDTVSETDSTTEDPDAAPLEDDAKVQAAAIQASITGLLRIFFSLVLVLGMIFGFVKYLLPQLLERYPDFFERLKERKQWSSELPGHLAHNGAKNSEPKPAKKPAQQAPLLPFLKKPNQPKNTEHVPPTVPQSALPVAKEPSKKSYLERLQVAGDYFQVLQTTILGKGKELHLVELKGKQFLVATTPYTVSLLKDLSEETADETPKRPAAPSPQKATRQLAAPRPVFPDPQASSPARKPQAVQPEEPVQTHAPVKTEALAQTETIAYLSDETPIRRVSTAKPYATSPGTQGMLRRKSNIPQFPASPADFEDEVYETQVLKSMPTPKSSQPTKPIHTQPANSPGYIDAEEVVVLEDYDDHYWQ